MTFTETFKGTFESDKQAYTAAMLNSDREPVGITEAAYKIVEGDKKGVTVYRLYEAHLGRYFFVKSFKDMDKAIKFAVKYDANK